MLKFSFGNFIGVGSAHRPPLGRKELYVRAFKVGDHEAS